MNTKTFPRNLADTLAQFMQNKEELPDFVLNYSAAYLYVLSELMQENPRIARAVDQKYSDLETRIVY